MTSRLVLRLLAVVLSAAALMAPSIANAEKVVTEDAVGDVVRVTIADGITATPAPDETATDIVRTVVAHGATRLSVAIHLRDLPSSTGDAYVQVATSRATYDISVTKAAGSQALATLTRKSGIEVECRALRARFDSQADVVTVSLSTACVEAPRWVRVGVGMLGVVVPPTATGPEELGVFADDGHRGGTIRDKGVDKGPKVFRG